METVLGDFYISQIVSGCLFGGGTFVAGRHLAGVAPPVDAVSLLTICSSLMDWF